MKLDISFGALPVQEPQSLPEFHTLPDTRKTSLKVLKFFVQHFLCKEEKIF
jgi:hypothetical protein